MLRLKKSSQRDDWYLVTGLGSYPDLAGTADQMRALARAIETRSYKGFRCCAVAALGDHRIALWNPLESAEEYYVTSEIADDLVAQVWDMLPPSPAFVIVESRYNRVVAEGDGGVIDQITVLDAHGEEVVAWDAAEWREPISGAFEAIIGVIGRAARGEKIERP